MIDYKEAFETVKKEINKFHDWLSKEKEAAEQRLKNSCAHVPELNNKEREIYEHKIKGWMACLEHVEHSYDDVWLSYEDEDEEDE